MIRVWIASEITKVVNPSYVKAETSVLAVREIVFKYFADGGRFDFLVLPFFPTGPKLVNKIREHGLQGPIIFLTNSTIQNVSVESMFKSGVLLINLKGKNARDISAFINFLLIREHEKEQLHDKLMIASESTNPAESAAKNSSILPRIDPSRIIEKFNNTEGILSLFQELRMLDTRIMLSFNYVMKREKSTVTVNLTSKLSKLSERDYIVLDEIQPKINVSDVLSSGYPVIISFEYGSIFLTSKTSIKAVREQGLVSLAVPTNIISQKRRYFRVKPSGRHELIVYIKGNETSTFTAEMLDLSERGFAFLLSDIFEEGDGISTLMKIDENYVLTSGIIKHKSKAKSLYQYGTETTPHENDLDIIIKYILQKQLEIIDSINREKKRS